MSSALFDRYLDFSERLVLWLGLVVWRTVMPSDYHRTFDEINELRTKIWKGDRTLDAIDNLYRARLALLRHPPYRFPLPLHMRAGGAS